MLCGDRGTATRAAFGTLLMKRVALVFLLFGLSLVSATVSRAETEAQRPNTGSVLLFGEGAGALDASYLAALVLMPPDAAYDISYRIETRPPISSDFSEPAVIVVASLNEKTTQPWTAAEVDAATAWVSAGGTLIFLGNSPVVLSGRSQNIDLLAPLIGAAQLQSPNSPQRVVGDSPVTEGLQAASWMESGGWSAAGLTTARPLISDGRTSIATVHSIGEGQVFFFGRDASRLNLSTGIQSYSRMVGRAILEGRVVKSPSQRESWILKAMGGEVPETNDSPRNQRELKPTLVSTTVSGAPIPLTQNGTSEALIILGRAASRTAKEAAETLRTELQKLTGADVPIETESRLSVNVETAGNKAEIKTPGGRIIPTAIVVGDSDVGKSLDVTSEGLPLEGYRIATRGNLLFLCGSDSRPDGVELGGTGFAVSTFLEKHCGVRWLWPGDLGSIYPNTPSLSVGPLDERDAPALRIRKLRDIGGQKRFSTDAITGTITAKGGGKRVATSIALLGRELKDQVDNHAQSASWFEHMRLGQSYLAGATHSYFGWWERYGKQHPEWFSLQPTGLRTQTPPREQLCQSSPGLVTEIARTVVEKFQDDPRRDVVSVALNDVGVNSYCFCEACRQKDPINAESALVRYFIGGVSFKSLYPALSDRVVGFYSEIAAEVDRLKPGAKVGVTAYNAYRPAPLAARLPANTLLVFVGTNYFDRHVLNADRQNWNRWAASAPELILRPNTLHQGHAMPAVFVKGLSEDLKHCYETGMIGADYDSIVHHWATQGLNYYVLAKLLWDPSLDPEAVVQDYCAKGFGPAAPVIREYFSALEIHTNEVAEKMGEMTKGTLQSQDEEEPEAPVGAEFFIKQIPNFYPLEKIAEWRKILDRARVAAAGDETILERIAFLDEGLTYAFWQTNFFKTLAEQPEQSPVLKDLALRRQQDFQRMFDERYFAVQFGLALWREEYFWKQAGIALPSKP